MQFYSLTFLYLFLPAALLIYNLSPQKFRKTVLALLSVAFYALAQPYYFPVFIAVLAFEYFISWRIYKTREKRKKTLVNVAIVINVFIMLFFSVENQLEKMEMPLGIMVISFTAIGYFVDLLKEECDFIASPADFAVFIAFFGKLYRGPLVREKDKKPSENAEKFSLVATGKGLYLFLRGLAKFVLLAMPLSEMYEELSSANEERLSVLGIWMTVVSLGMTLFYDLSGFCDMARGLGRCFGMELPKNFYFPFQSPSVTDFLDRFNMTVTDFFRHYIYDNLHGDKESPAQFVVDTLLICMLCGMWFGVRINYVLWGIYIAFFIIIEGAFLRKFILSIPRFFARIYTFCITMFSMLVMYGGGNLGIVTAFKALFGVDTVTVTDEVSYILSQNYLVIFAGIFFLTSAFSSLIRLLSKKSSLGYSIFAVAETAVLLVLITGELL